MTAFVPGFNETDLNRIILSLQQLAAGRSNAVGSVTLTTGGATTVITDNNFAPGSVPLFTPTTASAATELATMYVSARANKSFTITHANSATADRTFLYAILG